MQRQSVSGIKYHWIIFVATLAGNCGFAATYYLFNPLILWITPDSTVEKVFLGIVSLITGSLLFGWSMKKAYIMSGGKLNDKKS